MKTTTLILSAIIAALPFAANATQTIVTTQTPAAVGANGTVKKAATVGPYVTNEPTVDDQTHIATTAYVKGAYNDAIAAVNKINDSKQDKLIGSETGNSMNISVLQMIAMDDITRQILSGVSADEIGADNNLVSAAGVAQAINTLYQNGRVEIWTTWGDEDATTDVAWKNAYDFE